MFYSGYHPNGLIVASYFKFLVFNIDQKLNNEWNKTKITVGF